MRMQYFNTRSGAATLSLASNSILIVMKIAVGLFTGSVSVISEAIHSSTDLLAAIIAFFAIRSAAKPADANHQYGHAKAESLAAGIEAVLIFLAALFIIYEAARRLYFGAVVINLDWAIAVMAISSGINFVVSRHLYRVAQKTGSPALAADAYHLSTDLYTALGVGVGLLIVRVTGLPAFDPLIAIGVSLFIVKGAWEITRGSMADLLDESLPEVDEGRIRAILNAHRGLYSNLRVMRTRRAGGGRHAYVALEFPPSVSLSDAHAVTEHLESEIQQVFPGASVVVEPESPSSPAPTTETIVEMVYRIARQLPVPIHHVGAYASNDRFNVKLHLEVDDSLSLAQAHALATRLEDELRREIPSLARVDTHIEPTRREALPDEEQMRAHAQIQHSLDQVIARLPQVRGVHDIEVRRNNGNLNVSLHAALDGSIPIGEAHRLCDELEAQLKRELPQVQTVLVHTEPQE